MLSTRHCSSRETYYCSALLTTPTHNAIFNLSLKLPKSFVKFVKLLRDTWLSSPRTKWGCYTLTQKSVRFLFAHSLSTYPDCGEFWNILFYNINRHWNIKLCTISQIISFLLTLHQVSQASTAYMYMVVLKSTNFHNRLIYICQNQLFKFVLTNF